MKKIITITTILVLSACVLPMARAKQESESNKTTASSDSTEDTSIKTEKTDEKPAEAMVHNHKAEPHAQHESHEQHESHAQYWQHWAGHQKSWANSDDFKQWQKDMQEWTGKMQQWAKEMAKMKADMKNGTAGSAPASVPGPMPAMPPMPVNAGAPVLPVVTPSMVPSTGSLPVPRSYGTTTGTAPILPGETASRSSGTATGTGPILPSETASTGRSARDVEVKKDKDGKYVATRQMQFVSKVKAGAPLVIRNNIGRIIVQPSKDGKCDVRAVIRGKAKTSNEARTKVEQVGMTVNSSENRYYIEPITRDGGEWDDLNVDLFVTVPAGIEPDIQTKMGRVELYDFEGKIKAVTDMGAIKAVNTTGDVDLLTRMGSIEFIAPKDLSAKVNIQTKMGSIKSDLPVEIDQSDMFRKSAQGTFGTGQGNIRINTDMGSISLKWNSPPPDSSS